MSEIVIYDDDLAMEKIIQVIGNEMVVFNTDLSVEKIVEVNDSA